MLENKAQHENKIIKLKNKESLKKKKKHNILPAMLKLKRSC